MKKQLVFALVGFLTLAGGMLVAPPSASAHEPIAEVIACGGVGDQRCGYGGVTNGHTRVYSCDTYSNSWGFRTQYVLFNGRTGYVDDANGSQSGCSASYPGTASNPVVRFRGLREA
jgi:hypothetical protein